MKCKNYLQSIVNFLYKLFLCLQGFLHLMYDPELPASKIAASWLKENY